MLFEIWPKESIIILSAKHRAELILWVISERICN